MIQVQAVITDIEVLESGYYHFTLHAPDIAGIARPGQFIEVNVAGPGSSDPLLPRPISLYRINPANGIIEIIFKVVGRGTQILAGKKSGEFIGIIGPLGNGFSVPSKVENIALIAGGIGMPPLYCLAEHLKNTRLLEKVALFYGGRTKSDLLTLERWQEVNVPVFPATEDGSLGFKGFVTSLFIEEHTIQKFDFLVACGPIPMLKAVQKIGVDAGIPGLLSLEAFMACGVGACLGCVCNTSAGYQRVCADGPVFSMNEVIFNE